MCKILLKIHSHDTTMLDIFLEQKQYIQQRTIAKNAPLV